MLTAEQIIEKFHMEPLVPEGGFISIFNFSDIIIQKNALPSRYACDKPICGTILYLITKESFSKMHLLPTDEIYHFYMGDPVLQLQLLEDGTGRIIMLGHDILKGQAVQSIAPANCWHGSRLAPGGQFALLGTTMAPAYTDSDYVNGISGQLIKKYPAFEKEILERT